jgi:hypothetical protein
MPNWFNRTKHTNPSTYQANIQELSIIFRSVASTDDCLDLLYNANIINKKVLIEEIETCEKICENLRSQGLGLEPNLLGRTLANCILDRHLAGSVSLRLAKFDTDFLRLITAADAARDHAAFGEAQYNYWQALELFPAHAGYRLQYAHCLKEQGLIKEALLEYIDAYLYGSSLKDVEPHALFIANNLNQSTQVSALFKRQSSQITFDESSLDCHIARKDVITITLLLLGRHPTLDESIRHMLECNNKRRLVYTLLGGDDFSANHRDTLRLINESNWTGK